MNAKLLSAVAAMALLSFLPSARANVLAYDEIGGGGFGVIDLSTGAFTLLGSSGLQVSGIGSYQGAIYAGAYLFTPNPNAFYQVNPANGSLTFIGNSSQPPATTGSTTQGVYEFGYDANLYSINVTTGAATLIGNTGIPMNGTCCGNGNLGMSAGGSNLYIGQNSDLYLVNTSTGHASLVGSTDPASFDAMVAIGGVYYGVSLSREVFTFDPNTAAVTAGPDTNSPTVWGLAPDTVTPIPSALPLFASGLGAIGLLGWLRRRKNALAA